MSTQDLTAGEVMDAAALLMNDTAKSVHTYVVQLPYLQLALQDLRKALELNNSPITEETSLAIEVDAGIEAIGFTTTPALPLDLIEIQKLWISTRDLNQWLPMTRINYLPHYLEGSESNQGLVWTWISNQIRMLPASGDNDIKIDYIRTLFANVVDENSELSIINADSYLSFKTAAYLAEFVGENPTRALSLNGKAIEALDILTGIDNKGKQAIVVRRRPFRSGWKNRG